MLLHGDCLDEMNSIADSSIDLILADPPYGTTQCKWDSIIPLDDMWSQLKRIIKLNGAIVMTASQPFTTILIASNLSMFKYDWVWKKSKATGHLNSRKRPLVKHESILVFYMKQCLYNPQGLVEKKVVGISRGDRGKKGAGSSGDVYGFANKDALQTHTNYPKSIVDFNVESKPTHPTQKPAALMEYLIKTYTNEGDKVLDFAMGSGTTGVACVNTNRGFIGIEKDEKYFSIAENRIAMAELINGGSIYADS